MKKSSYTVVLDACVLYPAPLRDFLMELAAAGLFRAKWSEQIHDEWIRNVLKDREDLTAEQLGRTKDLMNAAVPDSIVDGYQNLVPALSLPDADDRHVLAAAIVSSSDAIVTFNLVDFPKKAVSQYDIEVLHPDDFIFHQFGLNNAGVIIAAQRCRARLKNPPKSAAEYLETLERQGLPKTVAELREYIFAI
ncbi:PIN domain-containing protein [Rhizobium bangladeshense]|nr:PIN domain-containing protein [Rhizobium bangladeshense]MBY3617526.1 PIN domain-containing protein [Rhizobium bangladeshense]